VSSRSRDCRLYLPGCMTCCTNPVHAARTQQPADSRQLHDMHGIHLCTIQMCRSKRLQAVNLPGCTDMLHKPCAATNTTACRAALSKRSAQHAAGSSVPSPMCYFGLAYGACSWLCWHVHKPCACSSQNNLQTATLTSLSCKLCTTC
jgi:hypothetical protein